MLPADTLLVLAVAVGDLALLLLLPTEPTLLSGSEPEADDALWLLLLLVVLSSKAGVGRSIGAGR